MARGTQHRKRRPQPNARVAAAPAAGKAKRVKHERWEDQLFFARLRGHAKWVFVFLALVFGVGFVIFGVGSGSTGISDVLQNMFNGSSSSGKSLSSLQKNAAEHPKDPKAWRNLATKLETDGKIDDAVVALKTRDQSALTELANLYMRRASEEQQAYVAAQTRSFVLAPAVPSQPPAASDLGKALASLSNPVQSAVTSVVGTDSSAAYTKLIGYSQEAVATYKRLAALSPKDAPTQLQLARVAQNTGDTATAIAAYKRFLVLAPDDPLAATAKKALEQLQPAPKKASILPKKPAAKATKASGK